MTAGEFNHLCDVAFAAHMPDFEPYASMPRARLMELMEEATHADPGSAFLPAAAADRGQRQAGRLGRVHPAAALPRDPQPRPGAGERPGHPRGGPGPIP
jgi:hypothetical protein